MWQKACLDLAEIAALSADQQHLRINLAWMQSWLNARPGRFRQLGLKRTRADLQMPPVITGALLSTQAASLRSLSIDPSAYSLRAPELTVIASLKGLTALHVHVVSHGLVDRGAAVLWTASCLPALAELDINHVPPEGAVIPADQVGLPRCQELSELRSQSLKVLTIDIGSGSEDVLQLTEVPDLRQCRLFALPGSASFSICAASFLGCTRLEELTINNQRSLSLQPNCFDALSALTSLTLASCGLLAVPTAIAPLTLLRSLDLRQNKQLQVDESGASVLRTLTCLRTLDVAKQESGVHSATSVQALVDLIQAFRDEALQLYINFDISKSYHMPATTFSGFIVQT